jgi:hypothetical protein
MFDILKVIPGKKKKAKSGWVNFNCPCCHNIGHTPDRRFRGGIWIDGNNWSYNCFNCDFRCKFILGKTILKNTRKLLVWCGMDEQDIEKWKRYSLEHKDISA